MKPYTPSDFWEKSHSSVTPSDVNLGLGIHHVGGGQSFHDAAALYTLRRLNLRRILGKHPVPNQPNIFELGSGGGYWTQFFKSYRPRMFVGSDLSNTAVERLSSKHPEYKFVSMQNGNEGWLEIEKLGPYDLCMAIDVLYHITDDVTWNQTLLHLC